MWREHEALFDAIMAGGITGKQEVSPLIARAKRMIEEYYSQGITMEEVARKLAVSPEYLSRQSKRKPAYPYGGGPECESGKGKDPASGEPARI